MSAQGTQAIDRAAALLALIVQADDPPTYSELCAETGYARSTTSRMLASLERNHLIRRGDDGLWRPGWLFDQYAAANSAHERLARAARSVMEDLSDATRETINLGVPNGHDVVQIAQVDSQYFLGSRDWVGVDLPAHTSALGKVLYAHGLIALDERPLEKFTARTVTTPARLRAQFGTIRSRGYASTVDELELGLTGIAAPVFRNGKVVAAIGLSGPSTRLADRIPEIAATVGEQAAILSDSLARPSEEGAA